MENVTTKTKRPIQVCDWKKDETITSIKETPNKL